MNESDHKPSSIRKEIVLSLVLVVLLLLLVNPLELWMPNAVFMAVLIVLILCFGVFAAFVLRERPRDERELSHKLFAGRIGYLAGTALLTIAIVVESVGHSLDPWLVVIFVGMILGKLVAHWWSARYR